GDRGTERGGLRGREWAVASDAIGHRALVVQLHGQVGPTVSGLAGVEDLDDGGVGAEAEGDLQLALEAPSGLPIVGRDVEDLQGHCTVEAVLAGSVHHTRGAPSDLGQIAELGDQLVECGGPAAGATDHRGAPGSASPAVTSGSRRRGGDATGRARSPTGGPRRGRPGRRGTWRPGPWDRSWSRPPT